MKTERIEIQTPGIKRTLRKFNSFSAIAEYVWNGFDAGAKAVDIQHQDNGLGGIKAISIQDDGKGIPRDLIDQKFKPFLQTSRAVDPQAKYNGPSSTHAKNGYGRLTFFHFSSQATWQTTYTSVNGDLWSYSITVEEGNLDTYNAGEEESAYESATGTKVSFLNIKELTVGHLEKLGEYLALEFAWYLELASPFQREIRLNGVPLKYKFLIGDRDSIEIHCEDQLFTGRYVQWNQRLHDTYSRYYFSGSDKRERMKKTTTFNNKGDGFYHSIFVEGSYFNLFEEGMIDMPTSSDNQLAIPLNSLNQDDIFKELIKKLEKFLKRKHSPFLRRRAKKFIEDLEKEGAFPSFGAEIWEQHRKNDLTEVIKELYEVEPRIFNGLNKPQKLTLVRLFNLIIDSSERDHLLDVLAEVVSLTSEDRANFVNILKSSRLSNVITTIKLIQDRYTAIDELKKMVFDTSFQANERDHLQTHIERHFWLFGEQYHLVTAAEPDFEDALRRHTYILRGEQTNRKIDHPDKNKEMDIFAVRQLRNLKGQEINNIVVELKHPRITLGSKEFQQVKTYMEVLLEQPEFNGANMTWDFYLVGNKYNKSIIREIENAKVHGERHLAYKVDNWKIYVLKWSEVFAGFALRHDFVREKLELERSKLVSQAQSADEVLANGHQNSAAVSIAKTPIN